MLRTNFNDVSDEYSFGILKKWHNDTLYKITTHVSIVS